MNDLSPATPDSPLEIGGHRYWLVNGKLRPFVAGGDGPDGDPKNPPAPAPVTFTPEQQAAIDKIRTDAEAAGRTAGATATKTEIDAYLADQKRQADLKDATEIEQIRAAAEASDSAKTAAEQTAAQATADRDAVLALVAAGVKYDPAKPETLTDALKLLGHAVGDDAAALKVKTDALKGRQPAMFGEPGNTTGPAPFIPGGTKPPAPAGLGGKTMAEYGAELRKDNRLRPPSAA